MKNYASLIITGSFLLAGFALQAAPKVTVDFNGNDTATAEFNFKTVPSPTANDAAITAKFAIVDGTADGNGGGLEKLHDGKLPENSDDPAENFFFDAGTDGGRLQVDLGHVTGVKQVNTYSWHPGTRGPQNYKLYASDGTPESFNAAPKQGTAPDQCGWKLIATVNTKPKTEEGGGQYGVSIADPDGNLGSFRYLLFDIVATEHDDTFGNTFFSEIDVIDTNANVTATTVSNMPAQDFSINSTDGKCTITINTRQAPGLKDWSEQKLAPVLAEWYPKITTMLASDGYTAPTHFSVTLKPMDGVAYTSGRGVTANSTWLEKELDREAVGSLVHEEVHVVQQFGRNGVHNPGWLVEGSADYIRWFKYELQSHGADLVWMKRARRFTPRYNDSYRVTANFLNWVTEKYDANLVTQMNAAMRAGKYDDGLWKQYTGKTAPELGEEWKKEIEAQLATAPASAKGN
jgi:hypothetical protein